MYICVECNEIFDDPLAVLEKHGFTDGMYERIDVCPHCLSSAYETARFCEKCHATIPESQSEYQLCPNCEKAVIEAFKKALAGFTPNELRYIDDFIDGTGLTALNNKQKKEK